MRQGTAQQRARPLDAFRPGPGRGQHGDRLRDHAQQLVGMRRALAQPPHVVSLPLRSVHPAPPRASWHEE